MTRERRFVFVVSLSSMVLLMLGAPAVAQDSPLTAAALPARARALAPAPPAKAAALPPAGASDIEADPGRKWEVEIHAAGTLSFNPVSGTSFLPPVGAGFTGPSGGSSLIVPSWYFGAGANLYNTVELNHPTFLSQAIASLDPVLTSPVVRRDPGPGFGARLSRQLTPRFWVEADADYNLATLAFHGAATPIQLASSTWQTAFSQLFNATSCPACTAVSVASVPTLHDHHGHELMATGALNVNVWTHGRAIPYFTVGGGALFSLGDTPSATLVGEYKFTFAGAPHDERDAIRLRYAVPDPVATGFFGGGVKYYIRPRYGLRVELRDYVSHYHVDNLLDTAPTVATLTPANAIATAGSPSLVFSNNPSTGFPSSLSAPPISSFRTLAGSGTLHQLQMTLGFFYRF